MNQPKQMEMILLYSMKKNKAPGIEVEKIHHNLNYEEIKYNKAKSMLLENIGKSGILSVKSK